MRCFELHSDAISIATSGNHVRGRLRSKIRNYLSDFKRLSNYPRNKTDIVKKRKVLQRGGIVGVLTAIARPVIPILTQLLTR